MSEVNERPTPPGDYECCEAGCSPCVWDRYHEEMRVWTEQQKAAKAAKEAGEKNANP